MTHSFPTRLSSDLCPLLIMEGSKNRPITGPIGLAKLNRDITVMPGLNGAFRNGGARLRGEDGQRREGGKDDNTELQESISFDSICRSSQHSAFRSEEHTSELHSLMRNSYPVL